MKTNRFATAALLALTALAACGGPPPANTPYDLASLRSSAKGSVDGEKVGRWLLDDGGLEPQACE